jgi:hypothetical protein
VPPVLDPFTAIADGEITACIQENVSEEGQDFGGEESAEVDVTIDAPEPPFSQDQKLIFTGLRAVNVGLEISLWVGGAICFIAVNPCAAGFASAIVTTRPLFSGQRIWLDSLIADPPDDNFKAIAKPIVPDISPFTTEDGFTEEEAEAANDLLENLAHGFAFERALATSLNRAQSAHDAGSREWEDKQIRAAQDYAAELAKLFDARVELSDTLADVLKFGKDEVPQITASDILQFQVEVSEQGLPEEDVEALRQLDLSNAQIEQIERGLIVQDGEEALALGTFPQMLTDPSVTESLRDAAQALRQFAGAKAGDDDNGDDNHEDKDKRN